MRVELIPAVIGRESDPEQVAELNTSPVYFNFTAVGFEFLMKFEMFFTPSSTCNFIFLKHVFTASTLPEHLCSSNTESPQQA